MASDWSRRQLIGATLGALALPSGSLAQTRYPAQRITYVSPYPPGATNDSTARIVAKALSDWFTQPVVVENKPGAGGTVGADFVAKSQADGYTLLNASSGNLSTAPLLVKAGFDPFKDLVPVGYVGASRSVIAVHPSLPVTSLQELIAFARDNPGKLNFGSAGTGSAGHIAGEYLKLRTGINIVYVPYRGSAAAASDLIAGIIQIFIDPLAAPYVRAGKARGLAFYGIRSSDDLPGLPTVADAGFPDWELSSFFFTAAPAGTPPEIITVLNSALRAIAADTDCAGALQALGVEARPLWPEEVAIQLRAEYDVNKRVIAAAKILAG